MTRNNKVLAVLLLIILALVIYIIVKGGGSDDAEAFDPTELRKEIHVKDSIATHWQEEAEAWHNMANTLGDKSDSLGNLKPTIKHHYHEKYIFNANATSSQLDSVIRAGWEGH